MSTADSCFFKDHEKDGIRITLLSSFDRFRLKLDLIALISLKQCFIKKKISHIPGVGKTSLVAKYIANIYSKEIGPTIGASFFTCKINLNNTKVKMQLWDTAGQERFKAMAPMYYRNANAALLVFDVTSSLSFNEVKSWILELQKNVQEPMFLLLVGNKTDLDDQRAVSREEAFMYSQSIGAKFLETSVVRDQVGFG